ncbi:MAG: hypothetical protein IJ358_02695 [Clostridia bacterium]|nr:hypothetical protein [Clostridia bacterium]
MAKDAKKTKTKAKINWGWDAPENRQGGKATRSSSKKVNVTDDISITVSKRSRRRKSSLGFKAILIILLVTIIGGAIGVGACWIVSRDDCFKIVGNEEITLTLRTEGEEINTRNSYYDEGVKVVSFGRDISNKVTIETDLKQNEDGSFTADEIGTYYIIYKVDDIKYGKIFTVERIRLITFVEGQEPDINVD